MAEYDLDGRVVWPERPLFGLVASPPAIEVAWQLSETDSTGFAPEERLCSLDRLADALLDALCVDAEQSAVQWARALAGAGLLELVARGYVMLVGPVVCPEHADVPGTFTHDGLVVVLMDEFARRWDDLWALDSSPSG